MIYLNIYIACFSISDFSNSIDSYSKSCLINEEKIYISLNSLSETEVLEINKAYE